ncbi:hypothetical protein GBZ86_15070, partial [Clostridium tarantellae]|nr:hypothetical protein [Clostridium tarantellae]
MGAEQILIELNENNILKIANIIDYCFRWVGWTIIKILASIVNGIEVAINKIYTLNDFFNSDLVTDFINKYKPLIWTILAIS